MKKLLLVLLTVCLLIVPVYAEEIADQPVKDEVQEDCVVVSTLDELQEAIAAADDGDIITISCGIIIWQDNMVETDKNITLVRDDSFSAGPLFYMGRNGILKGFNIIDTFGYKNTIEMQDSPSIQDCNFIGAENHYGYFISVEKGVPELLDTVSITNCSFFDNGRSAISCGYGSDVICTGCTFTGNMSYSIYNSGNLKLSDCIITQNYGSGIFASTNTTTINNCQIYGNILYDPEHDIGTDLYINGTLIIEGENQDGEGFFDEFTGQKIELPYEYYGASRLIYLTDEQATEHFAPKPPQDEETAPLNPGDNENDSSEPSKKPEEQPGDNDTTSGEQSPQKPTEQPEGENTGDNLPEAPKQPVEPSKDSNTDNPGSTPNTPQQPQKPADSDNSVDNDYTDYRPSQHPTRPMVTVTEPKETDTSQTQPNNNIPAPAKPPLICNDAMIDTSRTVVLLGYGDGLAHEDDPLTRAQLATIIYRLLEDESIDRYSNAELAFTDVATDAWYAPYVRIIQAAGIVNGVGDGKYNPNGTVTWAQIVTILTRFVEQQNYTLRHIQYNGWAQEAIQTAVALGWIEDSVGFDPNAIITRGELVQLINFVLTMYK